MKNLILTNLDCQVMQCRVCEELVEIPRRLLRDQHGLLLMVDSVTEDHRECAEYPDRPQLARNSREFRKRIEREQRRVAERRAA